MISLRDVVTGFGNRDPLAEVWRRSLRGGGGGAAEITGVPPLRYIGDGRPLIDYLISGNTVQDGTPSPDAPVDVVGCGAWDEAQQSYKLPMTVNGTEYPIYLGQVETTRRIKKLVLTGEETLTSGSVIGQIRTPITGAINALGYCTHYILKTIYGGALPYIRIANDVLWFELSPDGYETKEEALAAFIAYLSAQNAAGTPVTVWYVLATPTTGIVNEPLMKIGDYADTISFAQAGVAIPTVNGENVLDVPTEVPPSEITIKGGISSV